MAASPAEILVSSVPPLMNCSKFRDRHVAFVDDMLSEADLVAMQRHLTECAACARHDTAIRRGLLVARNLPRVEPSPDFASRLNAKLRELRAREAATAAYRGPGWGSFLATATGVVVVGVLAGGALEMEPRPELALAPVIASRPALPPQPIVDHAYVLSLSPGMPVWTAALLAEQAPERLLSQSVRLAAR
jgi:anti-sigma factor RsiW